jgi:uncharacterized protein YqeY
MRSRLSEALKEAMKARQARRVSTLRLILAAIKDRDIAARTEDRCSGITDDEILQVLAKMIRQRQESADTYESAGRHDLATQEREEVEIIEGFMPKQLSADELRGVCQKVVGELNASGLRDMGKCMGTLKERYAGQMDFGKASCVVKELLSSHS